jgi:hypothetical protein
LSKTPLVLTKRTNEAEMNVKRLIKRSEEQTMVELNSIVSPYGLHVNTKIRIADIISIEGSGISKELYTYALMAHFDFLVTDETYIPQFAVEFDGPSHDAADARILDAKKDELCRVFDFPLLRVKINYLPKKYNSLSLLEWIIDVYYLQKAFDEAQEKGQVPYDEPFDPLLIISFGVDGDTRRFPSWISRKAAIAIQNHHKHGRVALFGTSGFIGEDSGGNIRGIEYLKVNDTHGIVITSGMRSQLFPINFTDLLRELLLILVHEKLEEFLISGTGLTPLKTIYRLMSRYESQFKMITTHSIGSRS